MKIEKHIFLITLINQWLIKKCYLFVNFVINITLAATESTISYSKMYKH